MSQKKLVRFGPAFLLAAALSAFAGQEPAAAPPHNAPFKAETAENRDDRTKGAGRPVLEQRNPRYQIRSSDVLQLEFPFTPEFNQTVSVQPDGYITLRGVGDLHVAGLSTPEVAKQIQAAYAKILHDPVVTIELKDFEKPYFIAGGEIGRPGKYEMRGDVTLTEAVAIAGGFRETSKHSQVLLIRRVSDGWAEVKSYNLKKMLQSKDMSEDVHLHPGDMLYVPQNALSKVKPFIPIPGIGLSMNPGRF